MPRIDINGLLSSVNIDDVAERLGMDVLNDSATRKRTLCPFHSDQKPSLYLDVSRQKGPQHYHCYVCGAHGDSIDLVKEKLGYDFLAAIDWLASTFSLTSRLVVAPSKATRTTLNWATGLELGADIYRSKGDIAKLQAWATQRGFDPLFLKRMGLSFARRDILTKTVGKMDVSVRREALGLLEDANLIRKVLPETDRTGHLRLDESPRYQDVIFGDRVVIPIRDVVGRVIAFAARSTALDPGTTVYGPKYLLSRDFKKSDHLYLADQAFKKITSTLREGASRLTLYVAEGYPDALRLTSVNMAAVAVMGSSLSEEQISLMRSLREQVELKSATLVIRVAFDVDEAGLRGAASAIKKLLHHGFEVEFVWPTAEKISAEGAKDPDSYLVDLSNENAESLLNESTSPASVSVLAQEFGVSADDVLASSRWHGASRSRKQCGGQVISDTSIGC